MPHKKPRGGELSAEQKIVKDTLRLWKDTVRDMLMEVCVGLHNFRLRVNPWPAYE
jgi:hypothetical protein